MHLYVEARKLFSLPKLNHFDKIFAALRDRKLGPGEAQPRPLDHTSRAGAFCCCAGELHPRVPGSL